MRTSNSNNVSNKPEAPPTTDMFTNKNKWMRNMRRKRGVTQERQKARRAKGG